MVYFHVDMYVLCWVYNMAEVAGVLAKVCSRHRQFLKVLEFDSA